MILLLDTVGLTVGSRNSCFSIRKEEDTRLISPKRVESILVTAKVSIDSSALMLAFSYDVPLYYLDKQGAVTGVCRKASFNNASRIRRAQVWFEVHPDAVKWVKELLILKMQGYEMNLRYFRETVPSVMTGLESHIQALKSAQEKVREAAARRLSDMEDYLRGLEGATGRGYWAGLSDSLPELYRFEERSRNPAQDAFNAALNYLYGILYTKIEKAAYTVGMDPQLGIFHKDQYQKPALAFDLIEPFRCWADRFLFDFFRQEKIDKSFFRYTSAGVYLDKKGKACLIPEFICYMEAKTTFNGRITSRDGHIMNFAGELARALFNLEHP